MDPELYQAHHSHQLEDIPFWLDIAEWGGDTVLELGCGTGRVTLPLAIAGHSIFGLDNDAGMLTYLQKSITQELPGNIRLVHGDMTNFSFSPSFGSIIIPCNTLSTLDRDSIQMMLSRVHQHLKPQGVFAASLPHPQILMSLPEEGDTEIEVIFPHPVDGEPVQVSSKWKKSAKDCTFTWYYDHLLPEGNINRTEVVVQHQIILEQDWLYLLHLAGFRETFTYGDFDQSPITSHSPFLILAARK